MLKFIIVLNDLIKQLTIGCFVMLRYAMDRLFLGKIQPIMQEAKIVPDQQC